MDRLTDYEQIIYNYIINKLKEEFPEIQVHPGSPISDLFALPLVKLMSPFIAQLDKIDLNQNIANADLIDPDDLDLIAEGNYFMFRKDGSKATGYVLVSFRRDLTDTSDIVIPSGTTFSKDGELKFVVTTAQLVPATELFKYYNVYKMTFDIPVSVEAEDIGEEYNVAPGEINTIDTPIDKAVAVTNPAEFTGGTYKESNAEFVERIKKAYLGRKLGTESGYEEFVLESFPEISDVKVVGYMHPKMERDVVNGVHVGGKVDIYIRGTSSATATERFQVSSTYVYLNKTPYRTGSLIVYNETQPENIVNYNIVYDCPPEAVGTINEKVKIEFVSGVSDNDKILLTYKYILPDNTDSTYSQYFNYNSTMVQLTYTPLMDIVTVKNITLDQAGLTDDLGNPISPILPSTQYSVSRESLYSLSAREIATFELNPPSQIPNSQYYYYNPGDIIEVTYTYNNLVRNVQDLFDGQEYRIITTDVLVREANKKYIYIGVKIKPKNSSLTLQQKYYLQGLISNFISTVGFGGMISASDIINILYSQDSTDEDESIISYIETPIILYSTSGLQPPETTLRNPSDYSNEMLSKMVYNNVIQLDETEYPEVAIIEVTEII